MDKSQKASYDAGVAKGQTQEKVSNMMDNASDGAQSAMKSAQNAGVQVQAKAQGAADAVVNTVSKKDESQKASHDAGVAKDQTQGMLGNMVDGATGVAQSAMTSVQNAGVQVQATAKGAADAVMNAVSKK